MCGGSAGLRRSPDRKWTRRLEEEGRISILRFDQRDCHAGARQQRERTCMCGAERAMLEMKRFFRGRFEGHALVVAKFHELGAAHAANLSPGLAARCRYCLGNRWRERCEKDRKTGDPGSEASSDFFHSHTEIISAGMLRSNELTKAEKLSVCSMGARAETRSGNHMVNQDLPEADFKAGLLSVGLPEAIATLLAESDVGASGVACLSTVIS